MLDEAVRFLTVATTWTPLTEGATRGDAGLHGRGRRIADEPVVAAIRRSAGVSVSPRRFDSRRPTCGLATRDSDLAISWPPVACLDLAARREVSLDVLAGRDWAAAYSLDPVWTRARQPQTVGVPDVRTVPGGADGRGITGPAGAGTALVSETTNQQYARAGVAMIPLTTPDGWRSHWPGATATTALCSPASRRTGPPERAPLIGAGRVRQWPSWDGRWPRRSECSQGPTSTTSSC